jgi:hypothetical protein
VAQLGANAHGEVLVPGRVPDCYLGLHLHASDDEEAGVLVATFVDAGPEGRDEDL